MRSNAVKSAAFKLLSIVLIVGLLLPNIMPASFALEAKKANALLVTDYKLTSKLYTKTAEQIYDGTFVDVTYENTPQSGYQYLLVKINVTPMNDPIPANDFRIKIKNGVYSRIIEDTFLGDHGYSALIHTDIITATSGWMIFEIPENEMMPETWEIMNGALSTTLQSAEENVVEPEEYNGYAERQSRLVEQYRATFEKDNYTYNNPYVIVNPYETAPLTALIMFNTDTPMEVTTTVVGKTDRTSIINTVSGYNTYHEIPVIGLYNGENIVKISTKKQGTNAVDTREIKITTEEMPDSIKNKGITLQKSKSEKLSDGLYILKDYTRTIGKR